MIFSIFIFGFQLKFENIADKHPLIPNRFQKTVFSVKPLFKRFKRFEKSLYGLKRPIFESESV
jgi:hypothetical protein